MTVPADELDSVVGVHGSNRYLVRLECVNDLIETTLKKRLAVHSTGTPEEMGALGALPAAKGERKGGSSSLVKPRKKNSCGVEPGVEVTSSGGDKWDVERILQEKNLPEDLR
jgi:hypothetical protein